MTGTAHRKQMLWRVRYPRATTIDVTRSVDIAANVQQVFGYVADFSRAHEWRAEVVESTMDPEGSMQAGTRLREVAVIAGRRVITDSVVDIFEPFHRFTFEHVHGPLPVSGEYRVEPRPSQTGTAATKLRYTLRVQLSGGWRLLAPLFKLTTPGTIDKSLHALANRIEAGAP